MKYLRQSTAATIVIGPFLDDTDGKTAETALTLSQADVLLHKHDGTSIAQKNDATSATHRSSGYYTVPIDATDTATLGRLRVIVSEAGALPVWDDYHVIDEPVYDALFRGTETIDYLQTDMLQIGGLSATSGNVATLNLKQLDIQNNAGVAMVVATSNATSSAATFQGDTTGHGILTTGGATSGAGLRSVGGGTGSGAVFASGSGATGNGITATAASTNGYGMALTGTGTQSGLYAIGGSTGSGAELKTGASATVDDAGLLLTGQNSSPGLKAAAGGGAAQTTGAIHCAGGGNSQGVFSLGAGNGGGGYFQSGDGVNSDGIWAVANSSAGHGIRTGGGTAGNGLYVSASGVAAKFIGALGAVTGSYVELGGGSTGNGIKAVGGATSGAGLLVQGTAGNADAVTFTPHGTGYALNANPANLGGDLASAIAGIGTAGGAAINTDAATDNAGGGITGVTSGTTKVGTETGTYTNTSNVNGAYHTITHSANAIDWVYRFLTGGGTSPVSVTWTGYLTSANDTITFYAWNHVGAAWEIIGTQIGTGGTTNSAKTMTLYSRHSGTSAAELGKVYFRVACTAMTSPVLNTDQIYVSYAVTSRTVGYANGFVCVDTLGGTAGTESFVNGTADHPSLTLADGRTIAINVGVRKLCFVNGTSVTLANAYTGYVLSGHNWDLALGSQVLTDTFIEQANVTGAMHATSTDTHFENCQFGATASIAYSHVFGSTFSGTVTLLGAGDYMFDNCASQVAGSGTPIFDFNSVAAITCSFRKWSGGIKFTNLAADSIVSIDVVSGGRVTLEGNAGATVNIRGMASAITNTAGCTINTDAVINRTNLDAWQLASGVASVTAAVTSNVTQIDGQATNGNNATLSLKKLDIQNSDGTPALNVKSTGGGGTAAYFQGNGIGSGMAIATGLGASGDALQLLALATDGSGLGVYGSGSGVAAYFGANDGPAIWAYSDTSQGVKMEGGSSEPGLEIASATGVGAYIHSDTDSAGVYVAGGGDGVKIDSGQGTAVNASGLVVSGTGTGPGLEAIGGATGPGIYGEGGATSGHGIFGKAPDTGSGIMGMGGLTAGGGIKGLGMAAGAPGIQGTADAGTNGAGMLLEGDGAGLDLDADNLGGSAPTAADIADAVWTEALADHSGVAGSTAEALADAQANVVDTAAIADAVWSETLPGAYGAGTAGYYLDAQVSDPSTGPGAFQVTLHTQDSTTALVDDVHLAVYDATNTTLIARTNTDTAGDGNVNLDAATYKVRPYKSGYEYSSPQTIVVAGAGTQNITLDAIVLVVSADPDKCMVNGYLRDAAGTAQAGVEITFSATTPDNNNGGMLSAADVTATTDTNGLFSIELARDAVLFVQCPDAGLELTMTVPDAASVDWVDWYEDSI